MAAVCAFCLLLRVSFSDLCCPRIAHSCVCCIMPVCINFDTYVHADRIGSPIVVWKIAFFYFHLHTAEVGASVDMYFVRACISNSSFYSVSLNSISLHCSLSIALVHHILISSFLLFLLAFWVHNSSCLTGWGCEPHAQPPCRRTTISLVSAFIFDLLNI